MDSHSGDLSFIYAGLIVHCWFGNSNGIRPAKFCSNNAQKLTFGRLGLTAENWLVKQKLKVEAAVVHIQVNGGINRPELLQH